VCKFGNNAIVKDSILQVPIGKDDCYKCGPCAEGGMECVQQFKYVTYSEW